VAAFTFPHHDRRDAVRERRRKPVRKPFQGKLRRGIGLS
jgi:hypothetical protein